MKTYRLRIEELPSMVEEIRADFVNGVIILRGDLAAGKTTLTRVFVNAIHGLQEEVVTSPTFSLQHQYGENLFHYDIYNHGLDHFISLGMLEELDKEGLHFIEWGDERLEKILVDVGIATKVISIEKLADDLREYKVYDAHA
jgi:tRNA threonylcarbamoyladenosine biosynthesis protein TsaE